MKVILFSVPLPYKRNTINGVIFKELSTFCSLGVHVCVCLCAHVCVYFIDLYNYCGNANGFSPGCLSIPFLW